MSHRGLSAFIELISPLTLFFKLFFSLFFSHLVSPAGAAPVPIRAQFVSASCPAHPRQSVIGCIRSVTSQRL